MQLHLALRIEVIRSTTFSIGLASSFCEKTVIQRSLLHEHCDRLSWNNVCTDTSEGFSPCDLKSFVRLENEYG